MTDRIELVAGDITTLEVDAIVNAANTSLLGGGGVDGAIHRVAGPETARRMSPARRMSTGDAKVTSGHGLPASWVIHTVGPVWRGGESGETEVLTRCYRRSLEEAERVGADSIAFPGISTGVYGFPVGPAAEIAVAAARSWIETHDRPGRIVFCSFNERSTAAILAELYG